MADAKTNKFIGIYGGAILLIVVISLFIGKNTDHSSDLEKPISPEAVDAAIEKHKAATKDAKNTQTSTKKAVVKDTEVVRRRIVTIDGTDDVGDVIPELNLWENYQTRTWAGRVKHGEKVFFIRREGDGVLVETKSGLKGWITYWFIKEEK